MKWAPYVAAVGRKATETAKGFEPWMLAYLVPGLGIDPWLTTLIIALLLDEMDPDEQQKWREAPLSTWKPLIRTQLRQWARTPDARLPAAPPVSVNGAPLVDVTSEPAPLADVPPLQLPAAEPQTPVVEPGSVGPVSPASETPVPTMDGPAPSPDAPAAPAVAKPPPPVVPQLPGAGSSDGGGTLPPVTPTTSTAIIPAPPPGLPENIREAWIQAKLRAGEYARGLGNHIDQWTHAVTREDWAGEVPVTVPEPEYRRQRLEVIREKVSQAVAEGQGPEKLASELGNAIGEWSRNWRRIARTELQGARNEGGAVYAYRTWGAAARVCRVPHRTACAKCRELFLDEAGAPRVFTVEELVANGVNVGRKQDDWKASVYPVHPNCICDLVVLPPGRKLDADLKMVDA